MKGKTYNEFVDNVRETIEKLRNIPPEYLNEAGYAAMRAWQAVFWYISFHDNFQSLKDSEDIPHLANVTETHQEYYRVIKRVNDFLNRVC